MTDDENEAAIFAFTVRVEKLLCDALGVQWKSGGGGQSVLSLIEEVKNRLGPHLCPVCGKPLPHHPDHFLP